LDLEPHRSQLITSRHLAADWIFVMEPFQVSAVERQIGGGRLVLLGDLDPVGIDTRAIPDPYSQSLDVFRSCYARIDRCVEELTRALRSQSFTER
jgi:protein-tyrosine-phosphatase